MTFESLNLQKIYLHITELEKREIYVTYHIKKICVQVTQINIEIIEQYSSHGSKRRAMVAPRRHYGVMRVLHITK